MSKAPVSTGAEYTFTNFTLAADDNQFIKSDKSSSRTHNPLSPLLKIIADHKTDKAPNEKDRGRVKERKYGDIIAEFQFLTYFRENIALSTINLLLRNSKFAGLVVPRNEPVEVFTRC